MPRMRQGRTRAIGATVASMGMAGMLACNPGVPSPAAHARVSMSATLPSASSSATTSVAAPAPATDWASFDAVPAGALFRLGSRADQGSVVLAASSSGNLATVHPALGAVEIRADGMYRAIPIHCEPSVLRYVGDVLVGACDHVLFHCDGATVVEAPIECDGQNSSAFSPRTERFACSTRNEAGESIRLYDVATAKLLWSAPVKAEPRALAVSDAGVVFASDDESVTAFTDGKSSWRSKGYREALTYEPSRDEVVTWNDADRRFEALRAKDGARIRTTPKASHSLRGPIAMLPDGGSWLAVAEDSASSLTRWDANDGHIIASWPIGQYAYGAAVAQNGRFAAALDDRILRVDLSSGKASAKIAEPSSESVTIASSRSGDRMLVVRREEALQLFDARSGKELAHGRAPESILRDVPIAFSKDGSSFVIANAYGELRILDAVTLEEKCRSEEVAATWLDWSGPFIVATYLGEPADDEQYRGGAVATIDKSCKVKETRDNPGLVSVAKAHDEVLDILFEAYERPPFAPPEMIPKGAIAAQALRVLPQTGRIRPAPAGVLESALAAHKVAREAEEHGGDVERVTSADGSTIATSETIAEKRTVTCRDAKSNELLVQETLPKTAWRELAIAGDGSWVAVPEGPSILVYPCRTKAGKAAK